MTNLFGQTVKPKAKRVVVPAGDVQHLLDLYIAGFAKQVGEAPIIYEKDAPLLVKMVRQFGIDKVEARLLAFLQWDDDYVRSCGFSIDCFYRQWNKLAARVGSPVSLEDGAGSTDAYLRKLKGQ